MTTEVKITVKGTKNQAIVKGINGELENFYLQRQSIKRIIELLAPDEKPPSLMKAIGELITLATASKNKTEEQKTQEFISNYFDTFVKQDVIPTFIREMSLVYLTATFEAYLDNVLYIVYTNNPESLKSDEKKVSYEEVLSCKTISEVREKMIEKLLGALFREDIEDVREYLAQKHGLELGKISGLTSEDWNDFRERFYRRNVIIHNRGFTNEIYDDKMGREGKPEKLEVTQAYLSRTLELFEAYSRGIHNHFVKVFSRS